MEEFSSLKITIKELFIYLYEALPSDSWRVGSILKGLRHPLPFAFPTAVPTKEEIKFKIPLDSLMMLTDVNAPLLTSCGTGNIGASALLNEIFGTQFESEIVNNAFHSPSADLDVDSPGNYRSPEQKKGSRGFHVIDIHGNWKEAPFIDSIVDVTTVFLFHVSLNEFDQTGKCKQVDDVSSKVSTSRKILMVRDCEASDPLLVKITKQYSKWTVVSVLSLKSNDKISKKSSVASLHRTIHSFVCSPDETALPALFSHAAFYQAASKRNTPSVLLTYLPSSALAIADYVQRKLKEAKGSNLFPHSFLAIKLSKVNRNIAHVDRNATLAATTRTDMLDKLGKEVLQIVKQLQTVRLPEHFKLFLDMIKKKDLVALFSFGQALNSISKHRIASIEGEMSTLREMIRQLRDEQGDEAQAKRAAREKELAKLEDQSNDLNISAGLWWREVIIYLEHSPSASKEITLKEVVDCAVLLCKQGFSTEFIDGDRLEMSTKYIEELGKLLNDKKRKTIVCSVIGPQSSGKSTLLNFLFGCNFLTSENRCTKGMNLCVLPVIGNDKVDQIILLDTEGLMAVGARDGGFSEQEIFDKLLVTYCISISDVILVNIKGEIAAPHAAVLQMSLNAAKSMNATKSAEVHFILRDMNAGYSREVQWKKIDDDIFQQLKRIDMTAEDLQKVITLNENNLWLMPSPYVDLELPSSEFIAKCNELRNKILARIPNDNFAGGDFITNAVGMWNYITLYSHRKILNLRHADDMINHRELNKLFETYLKEYTTKREKTYLDIVTATLNELKSNLSDADFPALLKTRNEEVEKKIRDELAATMKSWNKAFVEKNPQLQEDWNRSIQATLDNEGNYLINKWHTERSKLALERCKTRLYAAIQTYLTNMSKNDKKNLAQSKEAFNKFWAEMRKKLKDSASQYLVKRSEWVRRVKGYYDVVGHKYAATYEHLWAVENFFSSGQVDIKKILEPHMEPQWKAMFDSSFSKLKTGKVAKMMNILSGLVGLNRAPNEKEVHREARITLQQFFNDSVHVSDITQTDAFEGIKELHDRILQIERSYEAAGFGRQHSMFCDAVHSRYALLLVDYFVEKDETKLEEILGDFDSKKETHRGIFEAIYLNSDLDSVNSDAVVSAVADAITARGNENWRTTIDAEADQTFANLNTSESTIDLMRAVLKNNQGSQTVSMLTNNGSFLAEVFNTKWSAFIIAQRDKASKSITSDLKQACADLAAALVNWAPPATSTGIANADDVIKEQNKLFDDLHNFLQKQTVTIGSSSVALSALSVQYFACRQIVNGKVFKDNLRKAFTQKASSGRYTYNDAHKDVKASIYKKAVGCTKCCSYCGQKCCLQTDHPGSHKVHFHAIPAFASWRERDSGYAILTLCGSTMFKTYQYKEPGGEQYLPFEEHRAKFNPDWDFDGTEAVVVILREELKAAWRAHKDLFSQRYNYKVNEDFKGW
eukprot:TRINITY_DN2575_c0_g1_i2.p1 TRINITY_DN2575_c0_g1~~TRINITY_DN2575_c0_g1_i2.p1  ORF type:complete len:1617 (-),score=331.72 TRINITY_DN2575_c0_g1_i2:42-4391(-)